MRILGFKKEDTAANLAGLSGSYVAGAWYRETDTNKVKYAVSTTVLSAELQWGSANANTVQANLDTYITSNNAALAAETAARSSADVTLQTNIDGKVSLTGNETINGVKSFNGVANFLNAVTFVDTVTTDDALNANGGITMPVMTLSNDVITGVDKDLSNGSSDVLLATGQSVISYVGSTQTTLQSAIDTEKARIDAILSGSQADKDSFAEIVALVNSIDTENDNAFAAYVLSNDTALAAEVAARTSGDAALQTAVDGKVSLTGDETVAGVKTFSGTSVVVNNTLTAASISATTSVTGERGDFNQLISMVDRTTSTRYYLQVDNGELYLDTVALA